MNTINIVINDRTYSVHAQSTVLDIIEQLNISDRDGIAVAVNDTVIPVDAWESSVLHSEDEIVLINAVHGG
jgi:sulfur carrier protein